MGTTNGLGSKVGVARPGAARRRGTATEAAGQTPDVNARVKFEKCAGKSPRAYKRGANSARYLCSSKLRDSTDDVVSTASRSERTYTTVLRCHEIQIAHAVRV